MLNAEVTDTEHHRVHRSREIIRVRSWSLVIPVEPYFTTRPTLYGTPAIVVRTRLAPEERADIPGGRRARTFEGLVPAHPVRHVGSGPWEGRHWRGLHLRGGRLQASL